MHYKLTRGTMQEDPNKNPPRHLLFGYGLLDVGGVVVANYLAAGIKRTALQAAVHSYAQANGKKFETSKSIMDRGCLTIKRVE